MAKYTAPKSTKRRSEAMHQLYEQALMGANNVKNTKPDFDNFVKQSAQADADFLKNRTEFNKAINDLEALQNQYKNISTPNLALDTSQTMGADGVIRNNVDRIHIDSIPVENQVANATAANTQNTFKTPRTLKELGTKVLDFAKAHPLKAGGAAILGGINTAGLFDNSEIAGQAIGGVAGGVIPAILGANPYTSAMISMGGGALGSLYDKLVAKKKAEEAMQQQMYNGQGVY